VTSRGPKTEAETCRQQLKTTKPSRVVTYLKMHIPFVKFVGSETNHSNGQKDNGNESLRYKTLIMQILSKATITRVHSLRNEYDDCHRNKY
jgi:hypothetical protein